MVSGVDIALWDLRGKAIGESVSRLLGGRRRDRIQAYVTGHFWPPVDSFDELHEAVVAEATGHIAAGFDALKIKIGLRRHFGWGSEYDVELVRTVREAVGNDVRLMADANHAYDLGEARRVARGLADLDIYFFEEPMPPEYLDGYGRLNAETDVSIAGGECWAFVEEFNRALAAGAADYLQPDVTSVGGFTSLRRVAANGHAAGIQVLPHVFGSVVALAASLQGLSTIPSDPLLEFDRTPNPIRTDLAVDPITNNGNAVSIPDGPGLGIEIDPDILEEFRLD